MEERKTIKGCLEIIFKQMKPGTEFYGLWLHDKVSQLNNKYMFTYPDTILRVARKYYRNDFRVKDRKKSLYERI